MGMFDDLLPKPGGMFADLMPNKPDLASVEGATATIPARDAKDKLLGTTGDRYQTWPERVIRGLGTAALDAGTLPHDVMKEAQQAPPAQISDSDVSRLSAPAALNFASILAPVNPGVRAGDRAFPGILRATTDVKAVVPTTAELAKAGASDINAAKNSGLVLTGSSIGDASKQIQQQLYDSGVHPVQADSTFKLLKEIENAPPGATFTAANLQSLREALGGIAQNFNPNFAQDQLAASRAIKGLDKFLPNVAEKDVLAGAPSATSELFTKGRGNYAAAMRSNNLTGELDRANTGLLERAQNRAQAANSGKNLDNTIRSKIAALLEKPKEVSGLSDGEISALNDTVQGGVARNSARYVGNLLGGGGGIGQAVMASLAAAPGFVAGGVPGAILTGSVPAVIGSGAKAVANSLAKRSLNAADELIRQRSPLFLDRQGKAGTEVVSPEKRAAIVRALMLMQQQ